MLILSVPIAPRPNLHPFWITLVRQKTSKLRETKVGMVLVLLWLLVFKITKCTTILILVKSKQARTIEVMVVPSQVKSISCEAGCMIREEGTLGTFSYTIIALLSCH